MKKPEIGAITWFDLTVPNATEIRDFYSKVVGWEASPVSMGDYDDFSMSAPASDETKAGICHKRGANGNLPSQWMIYITVESVDESARLCTENGGKILADPKKIESYGTFCVIEDPAGAVCALFEPA